MNEPKIPAEEFRARVGAIRAAMERLDIDAFFVYGDEYRKENLRYVSNYWPMFERGALLVGRGAEPILLCAPEGQKVAEEMSVWPDIRLVPDFLCATVPDKIDYPLAQYTDFPTLAAEMRRSGPVRRLGVAGIDAMSYTLYRTLEKAFAAEIVDCNATLFELRATKSEREIACLARAAGIADRAYGRLLSSDLIGMAETEAAGLVEGFARAEGAEQVIFDVFGSGRRSDTIIGRATGKRIEDGDMIMCALAVQYEGYVATCEVPFAVGRYSAETRRVIDVLISAYTAGLPELRPGNPMRNFVGAVKASFKEAGVTEYDVYPPMHGIGCAEAESPYPDATTEAPFKVGTTFNTDISLFGMPGGSNRIEEGFVITESGARSLSPFVHSYCEKWMASK